ncbi:response regulator [Sebaldella sp. S0638]|uniref:response regulator n=1 Tax=Sebaldella sp. S0638 TaxID=2957809 RepID=UPI00209CE55D|nr:response regulator [Sebaldella sp. S0638]MCP1224616.1 response regulator [Sebaldella sp. S0638]
MAKKALVVDDTSYIRSDIREILERNGFEVMEAENGAEAVELYKENRPDLVTMDINMPKIHGLRATQMITNFDPNANIIICSTMVALSNYVKLGKEAGAKAFLSKPFSESELLKEIKRLNI